MSTQKILSDCGKHFESERRDSQQLVLELVEEDGAARRFFFEQSHSERWLRRLDSSGDRDDGEAPISDADKGELRGVGNK